MNAKNTNFILASCLCIGLMAVSCGSGKSKSDKNLFQKQQQEEGEGGAVTRAQLQDSVQRFAGTFVDRITQALVILEEKAPQQEWVARRQMLVYSSSAVEIAAGQVAEVNLLDMLTFIELCRDRVEDYWVPEVFGRAGIPLLEAFEKSQQDIAKVANNVMTVEQRKMFRQIVQKWKRQNPNQVLVSRVRLSEVAAVTGEAEEQKNKRIKGLLPVVKGAVSAADETILLGNRAMFLSQQFPFLLRLQARIGTHLVLGDSLSAFAETNKQLAQMQQEASPLLVDLTSLARETAVTIREVESLLKLYKKYFPSKSKADSSQKSDVNVNEMLSDLRYLTDNMTDTTVAAQGLIKGTAKEVDKMIWTIAFALVLVALALCGAWWGGYYLAKRRLKE